MASGENNIEDEELYNRQIYAIGRDAQVRLSTASVLVVGCRGAGVECAKNLALMGCRSVSVLDDANASMSDLSSNFYLRPEMVGSKRASACMPQLAELNPYVAISTIAWAHIVDGSRIRDFQAVVITDRSEVFAIEVSRKCREFGVPVVVAEHRGAFGRVLCDFGSSFQVTDPDGEEPVQRMVASAVPGPKTSITVHEEARHGLSSGDFVTFKGLEGALAPLNGCDPIQVHPKDGFTVECDVDTSGFKGDLVPGRGFLVQIKPPATLSHRPVAEVLASPGDALQPTDFGKMEQQSLLHDAFSALHAVAAAAKSAEGGGEGEGEHEEKGYPQAGDDEAAEAVVTHWLSKRAAASGTGAGT